MLFRLAVSSLLLFSLCRVKMRNEWLSRRNPTDRESQTRWSIPISTNSPWICSYLFTNHFAVRHPKPSFDHNSRLHRIGTRGWVNFFLLFLDFVITVDIDGFFIYLLDWIKWMADLRYFLGIFWEYPFYFLEFDRFFLFGFESFVCMCVSLKFISTISWF